MTLGEWNDLELLQVVAYSMLVTMYAFGFYNIRGSYVIFSLMHFFSIVAFKISNGLIQSIDDFSSALKGFYGLFILPWTFIYFAN